MPLVNSQLLTWAHSDMDQPNSKLLQEQSGCFFQKQPEPMLSAFKGLPFGEPVIDPLDDVFYHSTMSSIFNTSSKSRDSDGYFGVVMSTNTALLQASGAVQEASSVLLLVLFVLLVSLLTVSCVFVIYERSGSGYQDDDEAFLEELVAHQTARQSLHPQQSLPIPNTTSELPRPQSLRSLPSAKSVPYVEPALGRHLCPELVVPQGNECSLLVPHISASRAQSSLSIDDVRHVPVFRASFQNDWTNAAGNSKRRIALSNANGGRVFAYVSDGAPLAEGSFKNFTFHHHTGALVGEFIAEESATGVSFAVDMRSGLRMRIARDAKRKLKFKDESGHLLAVAKTSTENSDMPVDLLRIGSLVDAGLVVLAMLCVQLQEEGRS